jgi:replicative DNA helicase
MATKLPFNANAEKTVLGAMLVNEMALANAIGVLTEEHFYAFGKKHKLVFEAIVSLVNKHIPVDVQTVTEELLNNKDLEEIGGVDYLLELTQSVVSVSNMDFYIRILQDQMVLRQLLTAISKINNEYDNEEIDDITDFIARADSEIRKVTLKRRISNFVSAEEVTKTIEAELKIVAREDGLTGIDTGYHRLNEFTHGFQKGEMIILAARPSVGKTALALNIGYNAARKTQQPVAIFSLEMPAIALVKRLIATDACVNLDKIVSGGKFLAQKDRAAIAQSIKNVGATNLFIDDTPGIKLIDIIAKARQLKGKHDNLGLIIVDYIGLITTGEKKLESRQVEVSNISRQLKELARELKVPVLVVSQLSREVDKRDNRRPMLSDLRESGSIEQDADQVLLMYRASYYKGLGSSKRGPKSEEEQEIKKQEEALVKKISEGAELVELRVAKNRNGRTGNVNLIFFTSYGRFDSPTDDFNRNLRAIREDHNIDDIED